MASKMGEMCKYKEMYSMKEMNTAVMSADDGGPCLDWGQGRLPEDTWGMEGEKRKGGPSKGNNLCQGWVA